MSGAGFECIHLRTQWIRMFQSIFLYKAFFGIVSSDKINYVAQLPFYLTLNQKFICVSFTTEYLHYIIVLP